MSDVKVGDVCYVVGGHEAIKTTISKIGRKYYTIKYWGRERKVDINTLKIVKDRGWDEYIIFDLEKYKKRMEKIPAWAELSLVIREMNGAPEWVTLEQINSFLELIKGKSK